MTRVVACSPEDGRRRARTARLYLDLAETVLGGDGPEVYNVAAGNAVLAGIAASDALCCIRLGRMSRGRSHHEAADLLKTIVPGGLGLAKDLGRVLTVKDNAHYGTTLLSKTTLTATLRAAERLVDAAEAALVG